MKRTFCLLVFTGFCLGLIGQGVGVFYTKNGSKLTGDKPQGFKIAYDQGFALGVFVDLRIADYVEISLQPGYQKIQSKIRIPDKQNPDGGLKDTLDFQLNYLSLPVLFKIQPKNSERFYFIGGPTVAFLLESKTVNESGEEQDRESIMNDLNFVLNFGFGYRIPIKSTYLFVEARYEQGLVNITDFGNPVELFSRTKTQGINLSIGFGLSFKAKRNE